MRESVLCVLLAMALVGCSPDRDLPPAPGDAGPSSDGGTSLGAGLSTRPTLAVTPAADAAQTLTLVPGQSEVGFDARTTFHDFSGRSSKVSGQATLEGGRLQGGTVQVEAGSIHTGNRDRDRDMYAPKYLDAQHFPVISFVAKSFEGAPLDLQAASSGEGLVRGELQVKQKRLVDVRVPVRWSVDQQGLRLEGAFPLDIRQFDMSPPTVFLVQRMEPVVQVRLKLAFARAPAPPLGRTPAR